MKVDREKVAALAKGSHSTCKGTGILGYEPGSGAVLLCQCVWRALARRGIREIYHTGFREAIGVTEPTSSPT